MFFQAEGGIRGGAVTGVQRCALPSASRRRGSRRSSSRRRRPGCGSAPSGASASIRWRCSSGRASSRVRRRRIALSGVTVEVETEHDDLGRYLAAQFPDDDAARGTPDMAVRVRWTEGPRPTLTPEAVFPGWPADVLVHRHVWTAPGRLLCLQCDDAPEIAIASAPGTPRRFELRFHFTLGAAGWREP